MFCGLRLAGYIGNSIPCVVCQLYSFLYSGYACRRGRFYRYIPWNIASLDDGRGDHGFMEHPGHTLIRWVFRTVSTGEEVSKTGLLFGIFTSLSAIRSSPRWLLESIHESRAPCVKTAATGPKSSTFQIR